MRFYFGQNLNSNWVWVLKTNQSIVVASSPVPYKTRQECLEAISSLQESIQADAVEQSVVITPSPNFRAKCAPRTRHQTIQQ